MSVKSNSPAESRNIDELLSQIERQGTPFRIDATTETYYVLTAKQLMALVRIASDDGGTVSPFKLEDFGLTEAEFAAYQARRESRREGIDVDALEPIDPALEQRLRYLNRVQHERPLSEEEQREREKLLHQLETAMLENLEAIAE